MCNIIFPAYPPFYSGASPIVDPVWKREAEAAEKIGFNISLLSESHFGSPLSVKNVEKDRVSLYRGWILKPPVYKDMSSSFELSLVNNYDNYLWSYEFPRWYQDTSKSETPYSFFYTAEEIQELGLKVLAQQVAERVGSKSLIIKDWLKSRKHEWYDACFIRDASDTIETIRIMSNFFKLQGRDFYGGLVFRDFLNLKKIGFHPKSRMPLPLEFRTFFFNGTPFFTIPYWGNDVAYPENMEFPPKDWLQSIGDSIRSPFVALDLAQDESSKWWIIEVNDGGSAGLPDHVNLQEFYSILYEKVCYELSKI